MPIQDSHLLSARVNHTDIGAADTWTAMRMTESPGFGPFVGDAAGCPYQAFWALVNEQDNTQQYRNWFSNNNQSCVYGTSAYHDVSPNPGTASEAWDLQAKWKSSNTPNGDWRSIGVFDQ